MVTFIEFMSLLDGEYKETAAPKQSKASSIVQNAINTVRSWFR
ncbi:MAG: hypothetical protein UT24_C0016G0059 [Candidatus Woesebacteria bacterium GW2011_GWB1_39_12]|uniref:Uncharacterized protein n=1 Tax=Candidatus Woesebacteria bacterium GW2011_GWB1_39_12 TaxID=1618574 RepID=A0A0G0PPS9_9BACT|nr:MAG: hypothetical protein UT24_C0016G0059 [Candidatus Woesebacteria bacterium GW2011_GWB1_39_12]